MTYTSPFTAVTGAVITAAGWNTSGRDNLNHLRALLPDAGGANYFLVSSSATGAAWVARNTAVLAAIGTGGITENYIGNGAVTSLKLAGSAVTTDRINDLAVTNAKMGAGAALANIGTGGITETYLADSAVTSAKIADGTIVAGDLASNAVTTAKITDANVTYAKLASDVFKGGLHGAFSGSQALTTSYADVTGASFSADKDGVWLVICNMEHTTAIGDGVASCGIYAGGVQEEGLGVVVAGTTVVGNAVAVALITVSGTTTIKAQVKKASGSGGSIATFVRITGVWISP